MSYESTSMEDLVSYSFVACVKTKIRECVFVSREPAPRGPGSTRRRADSHYTHTAAGLPGVAARGRASH